MSVNITSKVIEAALKAGKTASIDDSICPGLKLSISSRGGSWSYRYRLRGTDHNGERHPKRMVTIGTVTSHNPNEARSACETIKQQARDGIDPVAEAKAKKARERSLTQYVEDYAATLPDTRHGKNEAANLRLAVAEMNVTKAEALTIADVRNLMVLHRDKPATATHRLGALRRFLQSLVEDAVIASNPASGLAKRNRPSSPSPRTRVPTASEVQALWNADFGNHSVKRDYIRSMLLIPLRMREMEGLTGGDIVDGVLTLPGHITKNGDPFIVPLVGEAKQLLESLALTAGPTGRLFPFASDGGAMQNWSRYLSEVRKKAGSDRFGFHDTRRLFMSECAEHEAGDMDVIDGLLNHRQSASRGGVRSHYLHAKRDAKRRQIMTEWASLVAHAVEHGRWPREMSSDEDDA